MNNQTNGMEANEHWYRIFVWIAVVGGVFSLISIAMLLSNYIIQQVEDPLEPPAMVELREELRRQPNNEDIKEEIRRLDMRLRNEYFRYRQFSRYGTYVLIGSTVVFLIGIRSAFSLRKKIPMPGSSTSDQEKQLPSMSRRSIGIFSIILVFGALALILTYSVQYQTSGGEDKASGAQYPTQEEIAKNWPRFRGPGGLGISAYTNMPSSWDGETGENILWKTPVPLHGENSPVVWEDRIFLTGATEEKREVYCYDANSGELLWQRPVENVPGGETEPPEVMEDTGYAAPTAVTDGQHVFAIFANGDLVCFDFDGNQIWARSVGPFDSIYGYASSLLMYQDLLIILLDQGGADDGISEIVAMEGATGKTVWQTPRPVPNSWATPIIIDTGERHEVITTADPWVMAYDPITGTEFWRAECLSGDIAPSPVYADGLVYATNVYAVLAAIRPGGQGNVTETNIVWTAEDGLPDICSPLANSELVFVLETYGLMTCYDAKTGEYVWDEDLVETFKASPSLVGDNIYLITEEGVTIIVKAARQFEEVARYNLGEQCTASPAFMDGRIYIRGKENLYCIANKQ